MNSTRHVQILVTRALLGIVWAGLESQLGWQISQLVNRCAFGYLGWSATQVRQQMPQGSARFSRTSCAVLQGYAADFESQVFS